MRRCFFIVRPLIPAIITTWLKFYSPTRTYTYIVNGGHNMLFSFEYYLLQTNFLSSFDLAS